MKGQRFVLLAVLIFAPSVCGLTCLHCVDSPVPRDCGKVKHCGSHENCFIDEFITPNGQKRYNVGCRDVKFCISSGRRSIYNHSNVTSASDDATSVNDDFRVRSAGYTQLCASCCNSDLCNSGGCGATGYSARQARGPVCYTCAQQRSPESCDSISVCGLTSICKVKLDAHPTTGDVFYTSKCEDPQVCHQEAVFQNIVVGRRKRLTEEVDTANHKCVVKCCDGDLCNGNCGTGAVSGTTGTGSGTTNPCLSNPCVYGSCSVYQSSYVCTCTSGATGRNCDQLPDPCANNPCVHGTCQHSGSSYNCQCYSGYSGTNCDQAPNACASSPCQHGACHNSGNGYYCTCFHDYQGTNCDQEKPHPCSPDPCANGICLPSGSSYSCQCFTGYTGYKCDQYLNPCSGNPCGQHGVCHTSGYSYRCNCSPGWSGNMCSHYDGGSVSHGCSSGWLTHGSSCYYFDQSKHSWNDARSRCHSYGAYLAEANDGSEQNFLVQNGPVAHAGDWWIGGTYKSGHWVWDHSGHSMGNYWDSGFPQSHSGHCVELHKVSHGKWRNEDSCSHGNYYVCEKGA